MNDNFFSAQGCADQTRIYINGKELNNVKNYQVKHMSPGVVEITVTFYAKRIDVNLRDEMTPAEQLAEKLEKLDDEQIKANAGRAYQDATALRDPLAGISFSQPPSDESEE